MESKVYIGVDGGGTSTRAIAIDHQNNVIGQGIGEGSNPNNIGFPTAAANIISAISQCAVDLTGDTAICLGIAGLASEQQCQLLRQALIEAKPNLARTRLKLTHDLEISHYAAFRDQAGIMLIAGTGSACYARNAAGEVFRASGRDFEYDDPGSGYAIGKRAIESKILAGIDSRHTISALAPRVIDLATGGDLKALEVLRIEASQLAKLASHVHSELARTESHSLLSLSGSLLTNPSLYRHTVIFELRNALPGIRIVECNIAPEVAAAQIAQRDF